MTVEAEGFACVREPRQRLMRRAMAAIDGEKVELRLRNISSMGALAECHLSVAPGTAITIDILGVGPVRGVVRWAQSRKFGVQFETEFDLGRLAAKKERKQDVNTMRPWYVDQRSAG